MTENEALEIAKRIASERGWTWLEPVRVSKKRRWFRFTGWVVHSNAEGVGCNVHVEIDNATDQIVSAAFWPR